MPTYRPYVYRLRPGTWCVGYRTPSGYHPWVALATRPTWRDALTYATALTQETP